MRIRKPFSVEKLEKVKKHYPKLTETKEKKWWRTNFGVLVAKFFTQMSVVSAYINTKATSGDL